MLFIDTNIAIALRDGDAATRARIAALDAVPVISMMTRIELENGAQSELAGTDGRRRLLDRMLHTLPVIMFTKVDIRVYGDIVYELGFDRRLTIDRMIAAQAIARDAPLITANGRHFKRIEELQLIVWPAV